MNITSQLFGKDLYDLTLKDVEDFFVDSQQESSVLEFKTGDVSLEKIHREVAAFLNTEGGVIIIGAPKETYQNNVLVCQGPLTPTDQIKNQDRLLQSIAGNISPAPVGMRVKAIDQNGKNIYVVEVPQSFFPPHQVSSEGKYYIRLEREAKPAPHGIVEALFNQRRRSRILAKVGVMVKAGPERPSVYIFLKNDAITHAKDVGYMLEIQGVKQLNNAFRISDDVRLSDGTIKWHHTEKRMLVKGMQYTVEFDITLRQPLLYIHFAYYAADAVMEMIELIFDTHSRKYLHRLSSQPDPERDEKDPQLPNALEYFQHHQRSYLARLLNVSYAENKAAEVRLQAYDFAAANKFQIAESLVDFFIVADGFHQEINDWTLQLIPLAGLISAVKEKIAKLDNDDLVIGFLNDYPILYNAYDTHRETFTWTLRRFMTEEAIERESNCLYDLLDDLLAP